MQFFNEVTPVLEKYIRFYWHVQGERTELSESVLLPMDHIDLILTIGDPFFYGDERECFDAIHFHGIRKKPLKIVQLGEIESVGVSFTPWGFYSLAQNSMDNYVNKTVNLKDVHYSLHKELASHLEQYEEPHKLVELVEASLKKHLHSTPSEQNDFRIIEQFLKDNDTNIKDFCEVKGLSQRRLERIFNKYIGVSPKMFLEVVRFEESSRDVLYNKQDNLTDISHKHGFYDQSHFARVFKTYTNYSPRDFRQHKPALKSQMRYEKKK